MPQPLREVDAGPWFDDNYRWCLVALSFPEMFTSEEREQATEVLREAYPDVHERLYGHEEAGSMPLG